MRLPAKQKHRKKTSRLPMYLLLAVLATTLATTGTLARYQSEFSAASSMTIAGFAGGGSMNFDLDEELANMYPGDTRTIYFTVRNYDGEMYCDVAMDYEIELETTGSLPLTFTLRGTKDKEDAENNALAGNFGDPAEGETLGKRYLAAGGRLPVAGGIGGKRQHEYELQVTWPKEENNIAFEHEIDEITLTVTATQVSIQDMNVQDMNVQDINVQDTPVGE